MSKLLYPSPHRHIPGSRRWAYTLDGAFVIAKCRNGERPACYNRRDQVDSAEPTADESGPNAIKAIRYR